MNTKQSLECKFNELIGPVTSKRLFTGYGIFKDDIMFVLCEEYGSRVYLRAEGALVKELERLGAAQYSDITPRISPHLMLYHYYQLPLDVMMNKPLFIKLLRASITQLKEKRLKEALLRKSRIKELVNLSIKYERLLAKVEIRTVEEFRQVGADNAYVRLKKLGIGVNEKLYFMLYGALKDRNVYTLSEDEKRRALERLNDILDANGLRRIKIKPQMLERE